MNKVLGALFISGLLLTAPMLFPAQASAATLEARIDLSDQTMHVYRNGRLMHRWKVSTGRKGYRTPTGSYRPQRMYKRYYSRKYDGAPMPYSIFFRGGYAIHGTGHIKRLGRTASHGCVRLHPDNAARLYSMVQRYGPRNTRIKITH